LLALAIGTIALVALATIHDTMADTSIATCRIQAIDRATSRLGR